MRMNVYFSYSPIPVQEFSGNIENRYASSTSLCHQSVMSLNEKGITLIEADFAKYLTAHILICLNVS